MTSTPIEPSGTVPMLPPRFISFEGGEGAGKSTQARLLADVLTARNILVVATREPGGTPGAEAIRRLLLDGDADRWNPRAEALLFAAARADHTDKLIKPALVRGAWVIADRYVDSSRAYQSQLVDSAGLFDADILELHRIGSRGFLPDLTILLAGPEALQLDRASQRDGQASDRIGGRSDEFHAAVADAFADMAALEPGRFVIIDSSESVASIHAQIITELEARGWLSLPQ